VTSASLTVYNCEYVTPDNIRTRLDGDTFRCLGDVSSIIPDSRLWIPKVRIIRINAPETGQPGAEEARTMLINWLRDRPFNLICYTRDKYGRLLADAEKGAGLLSQFLLDQKIVVPMSLDKARELLPNAHEVIIRAVAHQQREII
jgi:endonuclease YncB( thermonuclease family)